MSSSILWLVLKQALLLAFYYPKTNKNIFPDNTQERSLMCVINIHACETVGNGEANLSIHAQKDLA